MSDWLEREMAREMAPVEAPEALGTRLGLTAGKRSPFQGLGLAVAAAVVLVIGGSFAASRTEALDLRQAAGVNVSPRSTEGMDLTGARLLRCDGGGGKPLRVKGGEATLLLAHSGLERPAHTRAVGPEADCHFCHSL